MNETLKTLSEYGVLFVIAAVFIWDKVAHSRMIENILKELQTSARLQTSALESLRHMCENTTTALSIIQNTLAANTQSLERHDKRSEYMNNDIREICTMLKTRPCVNQTIEDRFHSFK